MTTNITQHIAIVNEVRCQKGEVVIEQLRQSIIIPYFDAMSSGNFGIEELSKNFMDIDAAMPVFKYIGQGIAEIEGYITVNVQVDYSAPVIHHATSGGQNLVWGIG